MQKKQLISFLFILMISSLLTEALFAHSGFISNTVVSNYDGASHCQIIDVDGDLDMDFVTSANSADVITWWENSGYQTFTRHDLPGTFDGAMGFQVINLDGVNGLDIIGASWQADDICWWQNDGSQNFTKLNIDTNFNGAMYVDAADVNNDTYIDVVAISYNDPQIRLYVNDGSQNFTTYVVKTDFNTATRVVFADLDEDGNMDILATRKGKATGTVYPSEVIWLEGDGTTTFANHTLMNDSAANLGANCIEAVDMDKDLDLDLLITAKSAGDLFWLENDGAENFIRRDIHNAWPDPNYTEASDMDGDGDLDLLCAGMTSQNISWWENDGSQNFTPYKILDGSNDYNSYMIVAGDIDGDGKEDILSTHVIGDTVNWFSQIYFTPTATPTITTTSTATPTMTPTITPTYTITQTITVSPTITATSTVTTVSTITPTSTITATSTETPRTLQGLDLNWKNALAFPNPARDQVTFVMHLTEAVADVRVHLYNISGEQIAKLQESNRSGKGITVVWDCAAVTPGLYIAKVVIAGKIREVLKVAIVK